MDSRDDLNVFLEFDNLIQIKMEGLTDLRRERKDGKIINFHSVIDKKKKLKEFSSIELSMELNLLTEEIEYFTGLLYFFKPFINVPLNENKAYIQNRYDKRYLTFSNLNYQLVYNYWDRIGDLLSYYFETGLSPNKIYIRTVLNNFPTKYRNSKNYLALKKIYEDELKKLIDDRKTVVHYKAISTELYYDFFRFYNDEKKIEQLQIKKESLPDFFKKHLFLTIEGYTLSLNLINELPNKI